MTAKSIELNEITRYLDNLLRIREIPDFPPAMNGLQVQNDSGKVSKVAVAVDAAMATIEMARDAGADLLIVHHGLFWDGSQPITGRRYTRIKALLDADIALYSAHLPLDVHPELGNNAQIAKKLGVDIEGWFGEYKGTSLGVYGTLEPRTPDSLRKALIAMNDGPVQLIPGGPEEITRVGIISGGSGGQVLDAKAVGCDAFITGEGAHHNYFDAMEGGIHLFFGGHYATETHGVAALGEHLRERFGLSSQFLHHPTGL